MVALIERIRDVAIDHYSTERKLLLRREVSEHRDAPDVGELLDLIHLALDSRAQRRVIRDGDRVLVVLRHLERLPELLELRRRIGGLIRGADLLVDRRDGVLGGLELLASVERVDEATSDAYFHSRPRGSRISALASPQSAVIGDRETLEGKVRELELRFGEGDIPRPDFWGGYRLVAHTIEIWQGRANRLHDRLRYRRAGERWVLERLAP